MTDIELADRFESAGIFFYWGVGSAAPIAFTDEQRQQIIAALRRGHERVIYHCQYCGRENTERVERPRSGEMVMVLTELVRLYDWRKEVGATITDDQARKYGREKKAAWEAAKLALSAAEAEGRKS